MISINTKRQRRASMRPNAHMRTIPQVPLLMAGVREPAEPRQPIPNGNLMEIINYPDGSTGAGIYYRADRWPGLNPRSHADVLREWNIYDTHIPPELFFLFFSSWWQHNKASELRDKPMGTGVFRNFVKSHSWCEAFSYGHSSVNSR